MPDNDEKKHQLAKKVAEGVRALVEMFDFPLVGGTTTQAAYQFQTPPSDGYSIPQATIRAGYLVKIIFAIEPAADAFHLRVYRVTGNNLEYVNEYTSLTQVGTTTVFQQTVTIATATTGQDYVFMLVKNMGTGAPKWPVLPVQVHIS